MQAQLHDSIQAYLEAHGYVSTAESFSAERISRRNLNPDTSIPYRSILRTFDEGSQSEFIVLWDRHIKHSFKGRCIPEMVLKMEFYCHLHFAIWPFREEQLRRSGGDIQLAARRAAKGMKVFKRYIAETGDILSKSQEFIPFYALPYVPSPPDHPSFKGLFAKTWIVELRERLSALLQGFIIDQKDTALEKMFSQYAVSLQNESRPGSLDSVYLDQLERDSSNHEYGKIARQVFALCSEIVEVLSGSISGSTPTRAFVQYSRERLDTFAKRIVCHSPIRAPQIENRSAEYSSSPNVNPTLDFEQLRSRIKERLSNLKSEGAEREMCLIFQALRWRISLINTSQPEIEAELNSYVRSDLMGCSKGPFKGTIFNQMLSASRPVVQQALQLLNTIAHWKVIQEYLSQQDKAIVLVLHILRSEKGDTIVHRYALGVIQKMSASADVCQTLIKEDVIQWLVQTLTSYTSERQELSTTSLEYLILLLKNACLCQDGENQIKQNSQQLLQGLSGLIINEASEVVRSGACAILGNLLLRPLIKAEAKDLKILESLLSDTNSKHAQLICQLFETDDENKQVFELIHAELVPAEDNPEENLHANAAAGEMDGNSLLLELQPLPKTDAVVIKPRQATPPQSNIPAPDELDGGRSRTRNKVIRTPPVTQIK